MFKSLTLIAFLAIIVECNLRGSKQESPFEKSYNTTDLVGLWINQNYIRDLKKYTSITTANSKTDFFISILFTSDSKIEALGALEIEPVIGHCVGDSIKFDYASYHVKQTTKDRIDITTDGMIIEFERLDLEGYQSTFEGRDYIYSQLLLGTWKLVDSQHNQFSTLTFKLNNQLSGLANIDSYFPSSYLNTDILLFGENKKIKRSFIVRKSASAFTLDEVENFDWDDEPLKPLGKVYQLER